MTDAAPELCRDDAMDQAALQLDVAKAKRIIKALNVFAWTHGMTAVSGETCDIPALLDRLMADRAACGDALAALRAEADRAIDLLIETHQTRERGLFPLVRDMLAQRDATIAVLQAQLEKGPTT